MVDFYLIFCIMFLISTVLCAAIICLGNPVHAVISLICLYCFGASILFHLGFKFLSFILIIVYVGAIAILLLMVLMMYKVAFVEQVSKMIRFLSLVGCITIICLFLFVIYFIHVNFFSSQGYFSGLTEFFLHLRDLFLIFSGESESLVHIELDEVDRKNILDLYNDDLVGWELSKMLELSSHNFGGWILLVVLKSDPSYYGFFVSHLYYFYLILVGILLLIVMVGVIMLILDIRGWYMADAYSQTISVQTYRHSSSKNVPKNIK